MKKILFILFLVSPIWGKAGTYPIEVLKGLIVTEARIEGKTVMVILDSGAPGLVLNEKYYYPDEDPGIPCAGINGNFQCKSHIIKEWNWLGTSHKKTKALITDLSFLEKALKREIHALIGLSVLSDYYVSIDFDQGSIQLSKENESVPPSAFSKFQYVNHLPVMLCKVNGVKKILGIDTGSESNYLFDFNHTSDSGLLANASPVMVFGTDNSGDVKHLLAMNMEVTDSKINCPTEFIVDLTDKGFFSDDSFDGILGQSFLSQFNLVIHPGKQRILLKPRESNSDMAMEIMP